MINNGNNNQVAPQLARAIQAGSKTVIVGTLQSAPDTTFTLQFFSDPSPDPSGLGEGQQLLGTSTVKTNGNGFATFAFVASTLVPAGQIVTATATDPNNNTSEFSLPVVVSNGGNDGQMVSQTSSALGNQPQPASIWAVTDLFWPVGKKLTDQSALTNTTE